MKKIKSLLSALLLSGILPLSVQSQESAAQYAADEEPAELGDLVVTAALEPLALSDVASSVTVITREQIEQRQVKYLADLLRDVPGFNVSLAGGVGAQTQLRVRGTEANQMLVLIDGVRANDPASVDEFQLQFALTANVERIEIVRGPQSAIWGSDAMAGVINIIRRKDSPETWLSGSAEGGSFDTVSAAVDGGFSRDTLRLQGGIAFYQTDGVNIARQGDEKDGAENTTANLGLEWEMAESWKLVMSGQHVEAETQFDDVDFFVTGLPVDTDRFTEVERNYLRSEVLFQPAGSRWSGNASINYSDSDNQNFHDGEWNSSTAAEVWDARLRGSILVDGRHADVQHRFTAGLDYIETDFSQRGIATPWGDPNQDQSYDQASVAAEYVGRIFDDFNWTINARYSDFSDFDSITTWQAGFSHQLTGNFRARGSYGTGFKAPTFTERFGFYSDQFIGNPDLKPELSQGWELGFDSTWQQGGVTFGAVYFDQRLEDEIDGFVFDPDTFLFTAKNRETDSRRKGIEVVFGWRIVQGLELNANYTYTDSTESNAAGDDQRELRRPEHMGSLNAQYRFADGRAYTNLNVSFVSDQYDVFYDPATFQSQTLRLDSYVLVDLSGGWKLNDRIELIGRITNLTDEQYEDVLGYSTPGRAYYAGLRGRFDF